MDWKNRHKNHCEVKDIKRTEIIFGIHNKRLKDYQTGKTSIDRYYTIAMIEVFKYLYPETETSEYTYRGHQIDVSSGRMLTELEDHEINDECCLLIRRRGNAYLMNPNVSPIPLSHEKQQLRLSACLAVKEAYELVPLNKSLQSACIITEFKMVMRSMRKALDQDLGTNLFVIDATVMCGIGWGYGNPVFLSLKNALAYEDFFDKNFNIGEQFPFNLCCSILFPEFNLSMRTGNPEDVDKVLDVDLKTFLEKSKFSSVLTTILLKNKEHQAVEDVFKVIFDEELMNKERKEIDDAFTGVEGDTESDRIMRYRSFFSKCDPWKYGDLTLAEHCSESLSVCAADQRCFTAEKEEVEVVEEGFGLSLV